MKKVINCFKKNKYTILGIYGFVISALFIVLTVVLMTSMVMCDDLVNRVKTQEYELNTITEDRNYYYNLYDSILQDHEDCVPTQQYIDDIEYLESIIRDLRDQD